MKPIVGYEDYSVDEDGNVYSMKFGKIKKIKPRKDRGGYLAVGLLKNGKQKTFSVHRLLYSAFVGDIPDKMFIDHIDRNKTNNKLDNLRLVTAQQNQFNRDPRGYSWDKEMKKWRAYIKLNGKTIHLGLFNTELEAKAAYLEAKDKLHII